MSLYLQTDDLRSTFRRKTIEEIKCDMVGICFIIYISKYYHYLLVLFFISVTNLILNGEAFTCFRVGYVPIISVNNWHVHPGIGYNYVAIRKGQRFSSALNMVQKYCYIHN